MPRWSTTSAIVTTCLIFMVVFVSAECPNGCSGNGDCMAKDMCNCYKNYQGNDCADRTCLFGRAHMDTPKGDINMDKSRSTAGWILQDSQQHPAMTFEYFSPAALNDEAHFQMECSNKGICDRSTGLCQCFDGYEGAGCRRTTCPGKCSGHGTCESIRELGLKAGGTLFGLKQPAGAVKYDLWDSNSTYGCRCDPWYHGPDCSRRNCKVGVDPLYMSVGTPNYETFIVHAYTGAGGSLVGAWIRLRVFDYYGESYITKKIPVTNSDSDGAIAVAAAITAVPNLTFSKIKCEPESAGSDLSGYQSDRGLVDGFSVVCQYIDNPGRMRIPEIAASNFPMSAGHQLTTASTATATSVDVAGTTLTFVPNTLTLTAPAFVRIGSSFALATTVAATTLTLAFPFQVAFTAGAILNVAPSGVITAITAGPAISANVAVGDTKLTYGSDPTSSHPVGSYLFFHNVFYIVQNVYKDATVANTWYVVLDKGFPGSSDTGGGPVTAGATVKAYYVATNPQKMILSVGKMVVTTAQQGKDEEWFTVQTTSTVSAVNGAGTTVTLSAALTLPSPALIKVGPHTVLVTAGSGTTSLTLAYPLKHSLGTAPSVFMTDSLTPAFVTLTIAGAGISVATAVGDTTLQFDADPSTDHPVGSMLFFYNAFYNVQGVYQDATTTKWNLQIDKPFAGNTNNGGAATIGDKAYKVILSSDWKTRAYRYVSECSGRGMCGYDTGICTCFKGYTNDNCNTQNILAI